MRSAVILAGGSSSRLGTDKSLLEFDGKTLICWAVEKMQLAADEVIVVARSKNHAEMLREMVSQAVFTWDSISGFGPALRKALQEDCEKNGWRLCGQR